MIRKRISLQLTLAFAGVVAVTVLISGMLFIQLFRQYAVENRKSEMFDNADSISLMLSETSGSGTMRGMGFMHFLNTVTGADVWLLDEYGQPLTVSGNGAGALARWSQNSNPLPEEGEAVVNAVLSGQRAFSEAFSSVYEEETLTVGVPITNSRGGVSGVVLLHAPLTRVSNMEKKAGGILAVSLAAAMMISAVLAAVFSSRFTKPLREMNQIALAMAQGDYARRSSFASDDELGQLSHSLNNLAEALRTGINLLQEEKSKLSDLIASISEGVISFNRDLKAVSANGRLAEIMNYGHPYTLESASEDFEALGLNSQLKEVIDTNQGFSCIRLHKEMHLKFTLSPVVDYSGAVTGAAALVQDVSESEKLEQLRRDFVANVSHEFRTPLTVIKGSLEALADGTVTEPQEVSRYIARMQHESRGLERLVKDLMDLTRIQSKTMSIETELLSLNDLLEDVSRSMQDIGSKKNVHVTVDNTGMMAQVPGDYDRLRQLLVILVDNAIRFSPEGGSVIIAIVSSEPPAITVTDQGPGIPEAQRNRIWDRFYQGDKSRGSQGSGLGLSIAQGIAQLHGSALTVACPAKGGTVFTLTFKV